MFERVAAEIYVRYTFYFKVFYSDSDSIVGSVYNLIDKLSFLGCHCESRFKCVDLGSQYRSQIDSI